MSNVVLIDFRSISWGGPNEDDNNNVWALEGSASDPGSIELETFGSVGDPVVGFPAPATFDGLDFVFWNATNGTDALPGYPTADPQRKLNVPLQPPGTVVHATAWYAPGGPGNGESPTSAALVRCRPERLPQGDADLLRDAQGRLGGAEQSQRFHLGGRGHRDAEDASRFPRAVEHAAAGRAAEGLQVLAARRGPRHDRRHDERGVVREGQERPRARLFRPQRRAPRRRQELLRGRVRFLGRVLGKEGRRG